jgi:tetratricopeptide (TPR) repeat protein
MGYLAYAYQGGYRMPEALALFERARDRTVPKLGDNHPLTLAILRNLGHMLHVYGRTSEAVPLLEQVRERELMVHGGQHPNTIVATFELAAAYGSADDLKKSLAMYQLAAAGVERIRFEHSYSDLILEGLSRIHELLKQFDAAVRVRRQALAVAERKHGADSVAAAGELIRLGSLFNQQHKPADAEPVLRRALDILSRHPKAIEEVFAQSLLGAALADQGHFEEAEPILKSAYRGMKYFDVEHEREGSIPPKMRMDAVTRLVRLYEEWGRPDQAAEWRKEQEAQPKTDPHGHGKHMTK